MTKNYKYSLAITLFLLQVPTVWYLGLTIMLAQMVLLYLQVSSSFLYLNAVECMPSNPEDLVTSDESYSQSDNIIINKKESKILDSDKVFDKHQESRLKDLNISVKVDSDSATVLAGALNATTEVLKDYSPIISGTAVAAGTAAMTKSLPANQKFAGMVVAGTMTAGTMLASQYMNLSFREESRNTTNEDNSSNINLDYFNNSDNEEAFSPTIEPSDNEGVVSPTIEPSDNDLDYFNNSDNEDIDIEEAFSPTTESSFYYSAPLEGFDNLSMMTLGIILINLSIILGLLLILINNLISHLKLESNKFVINKPLLQKFLKASEKSREFINKFVFLLIFFGSCSMFYFLSYLLYFLKDLGL